MFNSLVSVCSLQYYKLMLVRCHCSSSSSVILCLSCLLHLLLLHGFFTTLLHVLFPASLFFNNTFKEKFFHQLHDETLQ